MAVLADQASPVVAGEETRIQKMSLRRTRPLGKITGQILPTMRLQLIGGLRKKYAPHDRSKNDRTRDQVAIQSCSRLTNEIRGRPLQTALPGRQIQPLGAFLSIHSAQP